jgi:hypothetical protein
MACNHNVTDWRKKEKIWKKWTERECKPAPFSRIPQSCHSSGPRGRGFSLPRPIAEGPLRGNPPAPTIKRERLTSLPFYCPPEMFLLGTRQMASTTKLVPCLLRFESTAEHERPHLAPPAPRSAVLPSMVYQRETPSGTPPDSEMTILMLTPYYCSVHVVWRSVFVLQNPVARTCRSPDFDALAFSRLASLSLIGPPAICASGRNPPPAVGRSTRRSTIPPH